MEDSNLSCLRETSFVYDSPSAYFWVFCSSLVKWKKRKGKTWPSFLFMYLIFIIIVQPVADENCIDFTFIKSLYFISHLQYNKWKSRLFLVLGISSFSPMFLNYIYYHLHQCKVSSLTIIPYCNSSSNFDKSRLFPLSINPFCAECWSN